MMSVAMMGDDKGGGVELWEVNRQLAKETISKREDVECMERSGG
jgi:hypothetical protein